MIHYNPTEVFPYVYLLHHLPSNSYYIGSRSQNVRYGRPPNLDIFVTYFTSSTTIKRLIEETSISAFTFQILFTCDSYAEAQRIEETLYWELQPVCHLLNKRSPFQASTYKNWVLLSEEEKTERRANIRYNTLQMHKNFSPLEKENWKKAIKAGHLNRPPEYQRYVIQKQKEWYSKLPEERKKEISEKRSQAQFHLSPDQREVKNKKWKETLVKTYGSYEAWVSLQQQKMSISSKEYQASLTPEERKLRARHARQLQLENYTPEETKKINQKIKDAYKRKSPEEKAEKTRKMQESRNKRPLEVKIEENRKRSESLKQAWVKRKAAENNTNNI